MYGPPDSWILREPPDNDFECECSEYHEWCDDEHCECIGHEEVCSGCDVRGNCMCDYAYDSWKEDRMIDR